MDIFCFFIRRSLLCKPSFREIFRANWLRAATATATDAAALAALRRNEAALAEMERALHLLSDATGQQLHREDADFAFHQSVAQATNNQYYGETLKALRDHISKAFVTRLKLDSGEVQSAV